MMSVLFNLILIVKKHGKNWTFEGATSREERVVLRASSQVGDCGRRICRGTKKPIKRKINVASL
jgi:hypothetical protein